MTSLLPFRITFDSISRSAKISHDFSSRSSAVSTAIMNHRDARNMRFEHFVNGTWLTDETAWNTYHKRSASLNGKMPDLALASELATASNLLAVLSKSASKRQLTGEERASLSDVIFHIAGDESMAEYLPSWVVAGEA